MKIRALLTAAALTAAVPALAQAPQAAPQAQPPGQARKDAGTQGAGAQGQGTPAMGAQTQGQAKKAAPPRGESARAMVKDAQGKDVGEVTFEQTAQGVLVRGTLSGLSAGEHAIHVHETGKCDAPDFKTAGGHFNPLKKQHGIMSPKGKHAGDLPNLHVGQDGRVQFDMFALHGFTVKSMFDKDGSAVVVHAQADDYHSDPAGDAGGRIGCGVVEKQ